ncbi:MAG TPA: hypothetical protein VG389_10330, partial [Myxococcota bacterium]|nr:hypothetical protein [Myxococcota bacterium]
ALAAAAYNAGPYNVARWWDSRRGLDTDEFLEEIPIQETYGYAKKVYASYAAYRYLYAGPDAARAHLALPPRVPTRLGPWLGKPITKASDVGP